MKYNFLILQKSILKKDIFLKFIYTDYQGRGIGRALMESLLDIADNWLMLKRVELSVFTDNERAVRLYESLGFVVEGTKRYAAVKNGVHADEYLMARYGK